MNTKLQTIKDLARKRHVIRPRDVEARGIPREYLIRLCKKGVLTRVSRGIYAVSDISVTEHLDLAVVAKRSPNAVVCLISALRFHGLTTQQPHEIWIALPIKARKPAISWPPIRLVRFSGAAFEKGVEQHVIEAVEEKIYSAAKTVADCFKYRNKIGLDIALEALRDVRRQKKASNDDLYRFAKICRVANIMRPYLEAVS